MKKDIPKKDIPKKETDKIWEENLSKYTPDESRIENEKLLSKWHRLKQEGYSNSHLKIKIDLIKGMGVYAEKDIPKDEPIEFCHSMKLSFREKYHSDMTLKQYCYTHSCPCDKCKEHGGLLITPFGFGSIYNSASSQEKANARYKMFPKSKLIVFLANTDIKIGEEILTWWGQGYYDSFCLLRLEQHKTIKKNKQLTNILDHSTQTEKDKIDSI